MHHYGVYRGTVVDNRDPQGHKRIKATVPQVLGSQQTEWIWPREDAHTKVAVPAIGQGVWVMFEGGDPAFPVWVGTFGIHGASEHHLLLKSPVSISDVEGSFKTVYNKDGTVDIDVAETLVALSKRLKDFENLINDLNSRVFYLESQL